MVDNWEKLMVLQKEHYLGYLKVTLKATQKVLKMVGMMALQTEVVMDKQMVSQMDS